MFFCEAVGNKRAVLKHSGGFSEREREGERERKREQEEKERKISHCAENL